jgi:WD40 repeat protein
VKTAILSINQMSTCSLYHTLRDREYKYKPNAAIRSSFKRSSYLVEKLELFHTLSGHNGCVNTILFSDDGNHAFTGSDDTYCHIYDVESGQLKQKLSTRHTNNIFYVKDLPMSQGSVLVSCAADGRVLLTDINKNSCVQLYSHRGRAHRLSLIPNSPCSFYSCGEDGKCCFFDIRTISLPGADMSGDISEIITNARSEVRRSRTGSFSVVEDASVTSTLFKNKQGNRCSIYCIHVNPMKPHEVAVAGSSQYVAVYDARR